MKTIAVKLLQTADDPNAFRVTAFENTAELFIGQVIPRERVRVWCSYPLVKVTVQGVEQKAEGQDGLLLEDDKHSEIARINPMAVAGGSEI